MQIQCFCGQRFTVPDDKIWTLSCHACGRKLSTASHGEVRELAAPKDEHLNDLREAMQVLPDPPQPPPAGPASLACNVCSARLYGLCAWCGEAHCWLHAPKGHPGPLPPIGGPEVDPQIPWVLYLVPILVLAAGLILGALLVP